jgi:asparagine synthase (glutamine-hydrolysing)
MPIAWGYISNKPLKNASHIQKQLTSTFPHTGEHIYSNGNFQGGFLVQKDEPYILNQRYVFENDQEIVFAFCRLDNTSEIAKIANLSSEKDVHETFLMYKAYQDKGEKIFSSFLGSWIFASYHKITGKLLLARDHVGMYTWYYAMLNDGIVFSTQLSTLLQFSDVSKALNDLQLAGLSLGFPGKADETSYLHIKKVPPAYIINIHQNNISSQKYWTVEGIKLLHYQNKQDYYEHFNELFQQSIQSKLIGKNIASTLSSGLDSTFVTAVAASELSKQGKVLHAITAVPLYKEVQPKKSSRYTDEEPLASLLASKYPNIIHHIDNAAQTNPVDGILKSLSIHNYPLRNAINQYWLISVFEKLKTLNVDTLLIGQMGNLTISWPFMNPPQSLKTKTNNWLHSMLPMDLLRTPSYFRNNVLSSFFIREHHFLNYLWKNNYKPYYYSPWLEHIRNYYFQFSQLTGYTSWQEKADYYGMNIFDPTADVRIIQYCFSLPDELYMNENGSRLLVREVAKNFVPQEVINNNKRGLQAADVQIRLQKSMENYTPLIHQSLDYVSKTNMFAMSELKKQFNQITDSSHVFLRLLSIILFVNFVTSNKMNTYNLKN